MLQIREHLFLGTLIEARKEKKLLDAGVLNLLCVASSCRFPKEERIRLLHLPLADEGTGDLIQVSEKAVEFIDKVKAEQGRVLVFCRQAQNRSPSVIISYLMASEGLSLKEAYRDIQEKRSLICPHRDYFSQLQELDKSHFGSVSFTEEDRGENPQDFITKNWDKN